jgi:predicted phage tail protein
MTKINLHGLLAFEFGESMELFIKKPKDVFYAIDANKKNFYQRIIELATIGCHYSIIIDGENLKDLKELEIKKQAQVIDLVPVIAGSGKVGGAILTVVGIVAFFFNPALGIALIGMGVSMMLAPKPGNGNGLDPPKASVGTASALNQSFYFSNVANLAQQGGAVPVGYGRLRIGSSVVQTTQTSYPLSISSNDAKKIADTNEEIRKDSDYSVIESRS